MKKTSLRQLLSLVVLSMSFLCGCGRAYYLHADIDWIGATQGAGSILVECNGPEIPTKIIGYWVTVDDQPPMYMENFSRQQITMATGRHHLSVVTIASDAPSVHQPGKIPGPKEYDEFGKKSEVSFYLIESGTLVVRYYPPTSAQDEGKLWVL